MFNYLSPFREEDVMTAYKKIMQKGILPLLVLFVLVFCGCTDKPDVQYLKENIETTALKDSESAISKTILLSDSLKAALSRIEVFDEGEGSNFDVMEKYSIEKESWLTEIAVIQSKLDTKIKAECPELKQAFIEYNEEWNKFMEIQRNFTTKYIEHYYPSGTSIFPVITFYKEEYRQRLYQYYFLQEIN